MNSSEKDFLASIPLLQMNEHLPNIIMLLLSLLLLYLAIKKKYEPFLLLPLGFGMLLANLPMPAILGLPGFSEHDEGGLLYYIYQGIHFGIYPPMIFLCLGGVLVAKILCKVTGGKINPLIGNAGVSAMPMAARVSEKLGQEYNPYNHLVMHAMGPIVASTLGSALVAGVFIALLGGG